MAINVTHSKVSTIPDGDDTSLIRPSDWNDDHVIDGLGTMAEQNANAVAITGGTISGVTLPASNITGTLDVPHGGTGATTLTGYVKGAGTTALTASSTIPNTDITGLGTASTKDAGIALGVATLDAGGTVPLSQIPASIIGGLNYQGTWNASTNTPALTSSVGTKGYYYAVSVSGTTNLNGITDWNVGDLAVFDGSAWQQIDNTDAVTSVNGYTGTVVLTQPDIAGTVPTNRTISTSTGLTGGGDLSADRTISFSTAAVGTWAATPSSANLSAAMTDETGSGSLVFGTAPTLSAPVIDGANPYIQFNNGSAVTVAAGKLWYDGATGSWNAGMGGGNITQQIGEEIFVYGKASATITEGQLIAKTGVVGASGQITFGPAPANLMDNDGIIGVATENIASGSFGRITYFGVVHGIDTTGSSSGQTWADGDTLYYNTAGGGLMTNVKPSAPNVKYQIATVIHAGNGGSGSLQVNLQPGTTLGGTDNNVQLGTLSAANLLTYSTTDGYWKNTALTAGTGISVGNAASGVVTVTNTAPDQTVSLTAGTGISTTGTYPNFTITNTAPSSGGTVTSITAGTGLTGGTITSSGTIAIDSTVATLTGSQILTNKTISGASNTLSNIGNSSLTNSAITINGTSTSLGGSISVGTVTSVTATSPVTSTGGNTPVIAMPAATGSVNGYLTSTDWTTFNSKAPAVTYTTNYVPYGQGTTTPALSSSFTYDPTLKNLTAPQVKASNGIVVNSKTIAASYSIASGDCGMSVGPVTVASGQSVTVASGSRWVVL